MTVAATAVNELQQDIMEDAYHSVEPLIHSFVWKAIRKFGGRKEEWLSEANWLFMQAFITHKPEYGSLCTWVWTRVSGGLKDAIKKRIREAQHHTIHLEDLQLMSDENLGDPAESFPAKEPDKIVPLMIQHLSDSAIELWWLIVEPPQDLLGEIDPDHPEQTWDSIQRYCTYVLNWTTTQMRVSIAELREVCLEQTK